MSDSYQAIFDAVRGRVGHPDIDGAVRGAVQDAFSNASHMLACIGQEFMHAAEQVSNELQRPSVVYRPALSLDGNMYMALYGADLHSGIAGFGPTAAEAMADFDKNWLSMPAIAPKEGA